MQETLISRQEFIDRRLADFRKPKDRKGRRPQEDLGTGKPLTKFLSLVLCACMLPLSGSVKPLLFASLGLCLHSLPFLTFLYFTTCPVKCGCFGLIL